MGNTYDRTIPSDALVIFGVTGDLAHRMIFPTLYAMSKRGTLNVHGGLWGKFRNFVRIFKSTPPFTARNPTPAMTRMPSTIFFLCSGMWVEITTIRVRSKHSNGR
uniref:Glucose-6-phosphate dehydrogenase NAD-binding domain-containing protein n=1 Tax=mine drainage metagenome TaxID=410659 RepID=E6QU09_9ZZZZ